MAIKHRITDVTYLRDKDGGITTLTGGAAEIPDGREGDVIAPSVAEKELAADIAADAAFRAEQNALAAAAKAEKIDAFKVATEGMPAVQTAVLDLLNVRTAKKKAAPKKAAASKKK